MRLMLLTVLAGLSLNAAAQQYAAFPTGDAVWVERHGRGEDSPPLFVCYGQRNGDTVLGAKTYHRLYRSGDSVFTPDELIGGLREDAKKVYYYSTSTGSETLLYDFNAAVGDTVAGGTATNKQGGIVHGFDSVLVGNTYRRRFILKPVGAGPNPSSLFFTWVEGIGNTAYGSLLYTMTAIPTCDCASQARCFSQSGGPAYPASSNCSSLLSVALVAEDSILPVIVPNPLHGTAQLRLPAGHRFQSAQVYTTAGILAQRIATHQKEVVVLESAAWPAGLYFCRLTGEDGRVATIRFVIP